MNEYNEVMNILEKNKVDNINMINFIKNFEIEKMIIEGESVLLTGYSDEKWTYISTDNEDDFLSLINKLDESYRHFVLNRNWMIDIIKKNNSIEWILSCWKYVFNNEKIYSEEETMVQELCVEDAEYIYNNYKYKEYASVEYLKDRIENDISIGVKEDGKLLAWVLVHDDGAIGMLQVLDDYRGRGYAKLLMKTIVNRLIDCGRIPFAHIEEDNIASRNLCTSIGFEKFGMIHWVKLK